MLDSAQNPDFSRLIAATRERIGKNERLRRNLPGGGRLRLDRQLPFLCIYRQPSRPDAGTRELVTTEAAYLFANRPQAQHDGLVDLCRTISEAMREHFGIFLFVEIWSAENDSPEPAASPGSLRPAFRVITSESETIPSTIDAFREGLEAIRLRGRSAVVAMDSREVVAPPGLPPLFSACSEGSGGCVHIGIAVRPIYHDETHTTLYPIVLQRLRRQLATALRKAIFAFAGHAGDAAGGHFEALGPSSLVKAARLVDQHMSELSHSFDFLLQVTPVNAEEAWQQFVDGGYAEQPTFHYRPLPYRPSQLKHRLFELEIERIEDTTLALLLWQKQDELDRQLSALRDIGTRRFLYSSIQLYGETEAELVDLAHEILARAPASAVEPTDDYAGAEEIAAAAREHLDHYHQRLSDFTARIEICNHIASGMMVSRDCLLIAETAHLRRDRLEPLLHHEVGTHLLTYFNGRQQPFRQLYAGLAGYEELQEGMAVLSEYLVGGLTASRVRTLAARVLAVKAVTDGRPFQETFALLHEEHGFALHSAFRTALRAYRGGGLTKDAIYLRGLRDLLNYLGQGHDMEPLYVGKIALMHVPFMQELRRRGIVQPPALLPRFWDDPRLQARLDACRSFSVANLLGN